uniref:fibronectin type III-like domain-contianing protein n=1 Tax=Gemmiger formicilis TaxID=745368 RepID=UPI003FF06BCF
MQLYIAAPQEGLHRPVRELKDFQKVHLQPGESETVRFTSAVAFPSGRRAGKSPA